MTNQTEETAASVSVHDFARVCKEVDREFEEGFAGAFAQKRTYRKAIDYADALAGPGIPVKSSWGIAEHLGYRTPGPVQSLIGENKWDAEEVWDGITTMAGKQLCGNYADDPLGIGGVVDETADEKRGKHTAGVSRQYAGCAGGIINCTTWVMLSLVTPGGKTWLSGRLFLPEKTWFTGDGDTGTARREKAGIPGETEFASKPELARRQFQHARELGIKFNWAGGDEVYGRYAKLRQEHEENNEAYAYFVPRNHVVATLGKERRRVDELLELDHLQYEIRSAGPGINGPRYYDWAMIGVESPRHFLLVRKPVSGEQDGKGENAGRDTGSEPGAVVPGDQGEPRGKHAREKERDRIKEDGITFCLCYVPEESPVKPTMTSLVLMAGGRWGAEETMATAKGPVGWDENQFRKYESLQRHTALAGLAMLKANIIKERLDAAAAREKASGNASGRQAEAQEITFPADREPAGDFSADDLMIPLGDAQVPHRADQEIPEDIGFIRLSVNEIIRLRSIVLGGMNTARMAFHLRWSKWRRKHQAVARWYHRLARMTTAAEADGNPAPQTMTTLGNHALVLPSWHLDLPAICEHALDYTP